jgi:predicted 3-demethylubiquinone-9 3-methyltransferase (glyoxalase superfamily)
MPKLQKITPCLWFDHEAEEAASFYTDIFPNSGILGVSRYSEAGREHHGQPAGSVMLVEFHLNGQAFNALNGGPLFRFTEAVSFQVACADQAEVDHYWTRLGAGGDPAAQRCGWLKDHYGLSWQIVPEALAELMGGPDPARAARVMNALLQMTRIDIAALRRAADSG